MSTLIGLICILCIRVTHVVTLSLCNPSNYLEVKEEQDNKFVCRGLTAQQDVTWMWVELLSICKTSTCTENVFSQYFTISRAEATASDVTVHATAFSDLEYLATTNLSCIVPDLGRATCQMDVIYPAVNPRCQIQISGDTWEVAGSCTVSKVRSARQRYGCYVYQTSEQSSSTLVGSFALSTTPILGTTYSSGDCQIKIALPPEGKYNYSVMIIPGEVVAFPSFNGSNEIRRPSESPQHNCPQYVTEGEDVNCLCYSDNLGLPSGSLIWKGKNSSKLKIDKVNRTYGGTSNTCELMWNNTAVQNVIYTVIVNYASRVLSFKINNKIDDVINVNENTIVSVVCQADGRPQPTIRLFKRSSDNQDLQIAVANNALDLQHIMNDVKCDETALYSCKSDNGVFFDQKYIQMIVSCAPKRATQDSPSATFKDGEATVKFKIIAYPAPNALSLFYIGSSLNNTSPRKVEDAAKFECTSRNMYRYMATCTAILQNDSTFSAGIYAAVFRNDLGNVSLTFEIKEQVDATGQSPPGIAGSAAGGVIGVVIAIALVIVIVVFIRRKKQKEERPSQINQMSTSRTNPERSSETMYDQLQRGDINTSSIYQSLRHQQSSSEFAEHEGIEMIYDNLQKGDINIPSAYQALGQQQIANEFADNEDKGKLHIYDVPIVLHKNTKSTQQKKTVYQNNIVF